MSRKNGNRGCYLKKLRRLLILVFIASAVLLWLNARGVIELPELPFNKSEELSLPDGCAQVRFLDVGQGDCSLIISDDGETMLIDSGEAEYSSRVLRQLKRLGITRLDYVVATHPHSDHMGGMADIISSKIEIGCLVMPYIPEDYVPVTLAYERLLDAVADKGCEVADTDNKTVDFGSGRLEFTFPDYSGENLNNYSVIIRFVFGERAFLFSGDAEEEVETALLEDGVSLRADVYKVAHHGSSTSSSALWLAAIKPDYCVIQCGKGNSYGHPHGETITRLRDYTDIILRTDINGTVVFTTDGDNISYKTERAA